MVMAIKEFSSKKKLFVTAKAFVVLVFSFIIFNFSQLDKNSTTKIKEHCDISS